METAYDIIFFWVARMMMLGIHLTGVVPFHTVYLSGLVRDPYGAKMSKTKGNVVDPLAMIDEYGADALRFALMNGTAPGNDQRLGREKVEGARNFANKLWNAARYVLGARPATIPADAVRVPPTAGHLGPAERWLLSRVAATTAAVDRAHADFQFGEVCRLLHEAIWSEYCDWAIEFAKVRLGDDSLPAAEREATWWTLVDVLDTYVRLLHPVMPFVTEAIWAELPHRASDPALLIVARWPGVGPVDPRAEAPVTAVIELVRGIRNARTEAKIEPGAWLPVHVAIGDDMAPAFAALRSAVERLARARPLTRHLTIDALEATRANGGLTVIVGDSEAVVEPASEDAAHARLERARLERELAETEGLLANARARLLNPAFVERAPAAVVDGARTREAELSELVDRFRERLAAGR
jgi:valyl-tRNA synthetase